MKKIGILNFQYSTHNYGAVLQAAALEYVCRQLGYDAKHLDFMAKPTISLKGKGGQLLRKIGLKKRSKMDLVRNEEAFERFREKFLTRTKRINSADEFTEIAKSFDSVVVGSDQVWRPAYSKDTIAFFLGYVPKGITRIAYAASFGSSRWELADDVALTSNVKNELRQFKAISCREESGVAICKEVFGIDAEHVLDPVLLIDDLFFEEIVSQSSAKQKSKLVYYKLDSGTDFQSDLKVLSSEVGSTAVNIYLTESPIPEYREVPEWLAQIRNSDVVVTDSFHCICLALRFGKEVIFCPNEKRGQTRLDSLFKKLHVEVEPLVHLELKTPMFRLLSRANIETTLEVERIKSLRFLADGLRD